MIRNEGGSHKKKQQWIGQVLSLFPCHTRGQYTTACCQFARINKHNEDRFDTVYAYLQSGKPFLVIDAETADVLFFLCISFVQSRIILVTILYSSTHTLGRIIYSIYVVWSYYWKWRVVTAGWRGGCGFVHTRSTKKSSSTASHSSSSIYIFCATPTRPCSFITFYGARPSLLCLGTYTPHHHQS